MTLPEPMLTEAQTLWGLVSLRATRTPDAPLLFDGGDVRLTCRQVADAAERVAAGLLARGIGPGSRVSWQLPTRVDTILLSLALARLGAVQNPIIHIYREREVGFALWQTDADLICVPGTWRGVDYQAMATGLATEIGAKRDRPLPVLLMDGSLPDGDPATLPSPPRSGEEVRWIYYTSGTTSEPKGVQHSDGTLLAAGIGLGMALGVTPADVGSIAFPFAHIGGPDYLIMMLAGGFPAVLIEAFDPATYPDILRSVGATLAGGSTAHYSAVLTAQRGAYAGPLVPTLRALAGGGAPKPHELYFEIEREVGIPVAHGYGMTEVPMITQGSPADSADQLAYTEGAPVRGAMIRLVTQDGRVAETGEEGEVRVRGPVVFHGYTDPDLNKDAFDADGWFRTGDLGVLRDDGHLSLTGRLKDVIIRKGENISAREVEEALYEHPAVGAVAVIGLPDPERGERVCAVVELVPGSVFTVEEMTAQLEKVGLARQKFPEQLEIVEVLPRNATLKILKYELRDRFSLQA